METLVILVFVIGVALGGVGGFFVGSGRTIEVSTSQHTEVVTTTIQNQSQVTLVGERNEQKLQYVWTNLPSRRQLEQWLHTLDAFQLAHCEIFSERVWLGTRYTVIYPIYREGSVTNTERLVLTNTSSSNTIRLK